MDSELEISINDTEFHNGYVSLDALGAAARFDNLTLTSNVETYYIRDAGGMVLAEYNAAGGLEAQYVYGNNLLAVLGGGLLF